MLLWKWIPSSWRKEDRLCCRWDIDEVGFHVCLHRPFGGSDNDIEEDFQRGTTGIPIGSVGHLYPCSFDALGC